MASIPITTGGLHFSFQSEAVLFNGLRLGSWFSFMLATVLTVIICLAERHITFLLTARPHNTNDSPSRSPLRVALRRTILYTFATILRLAYMLIAMSMNVGLIAAIVLSLSLGQLYIEFHQECSSPANIKESTPLYAPIPLHQRMESDLESMWDGSREARDKARSIMLGDSSTSGPLSSQVQHHVSFEHAKRDSLATLHGRPTSPIHRRQASTSSLRPLRGSGTSLPGSRGSITPTGAARKALFQIGSSDEGHTSESD